MRLKIKIETLPSQADTKKESEASIWRQVRFTNTRLLVFICFKASWVIKHKGAISC